jgi:hypothetical protein
MKARFIVALMALPSALALNDCGSTPTAPDRHGFPIITLVCVPLTTSSTLCRASVSCSLYPCLPGTPEDVTTLATWTSDDQTIVRIGGPGRLDAVGVGDTVVRAAWDAIGVGGGWRPVSVFPGTAPLPTYEISGGIYDGSVSPRAPLNGATIEIIDGPPSGKTSVSGADPQLPPGFTSFGPMMPGRYRLLGVPAGTFRLRATKDGYVPQERDVTGSTFTGADFELQRR